MRVQLRLLHLNAVQLSRLLQENVPSYERGESGCVPAPGSVPALLRRLWWFDPDPPEQVCLGPVCVTPPPSEPGFEQFQMSERLHANWVHLYLEDSHSDVLLSLGSKVRRQYSDALRTLSLSLSAQGAHYDVYSMLVGAVVVLEVRARGARPWD